MDLLLSHVRRVLRRENDRFKAEGLSVVIVFDRDLGLSVGSQIRKCSVFSDLCQSFGKLMGKIDRIRHVVFALVGRVTEHHTLVAGADRFNLSLAHIALSCLESPVDAHRDIGRLLVERHHDRACVGVESHLGIGIADLPDDVSGNLRIVNRSLCCDLAADQDKAGARSCLAGNAAHGVLLHAGVKYCI